MKCNIEIQWELFSVGFRSIMLIIVKIFKALYIFACACANVCVCEAEWMRMSVSACECKCVQVWEVASASLCTIVRADINQESAYARITMRVSVCMYAHIRACLSACVGAWSLECRESPFYQIRWNSESPKLFKA